MCLKSIGKKKKENKVYFLVTEQILDYKNKSTAETSSWGKYKIFLISFQKLLQNSRKKKLIIA